MAKNRLFDDQWLAGSYADDSWASDVINDIDGNGSVYLNCLSNWFEKLPGSNKGKNALRSGLRNPDNSAHLGAVNELSWWIYVTSRGLSLDRIPKGSSHTPDYVLNAHGEHIIFEVTTLNPSKDISCRDLQYSQENSIRRIFRNAVEEKVQQFIYGAKKGMPVVLVVFNYDEWSGFGSKFSSIFNSSISSFVLPKELSSIIYLERFVMDGKLFYKKENVSIFRNSEAQYVLNPGITESFLESENDYLPCEKA